MQKKVMIVEDDFIIRMFIEKVIKSLGADIVAKASESKEAIAHFVNHKPDLILMDIGIRGNLDGIQTVQQIREKGQAEVIYLTGNSDEKTIERAQETQPFGYIFKPIDELKLIKELKRFFDMEK